VKVREAGRDDSDWEHAIAVTAQTTWTEEDFLGNGTRFTLNPKPHTLSPKS